MPRKAAGTQRPKIIAQKQLNGRKWEKLRKNNLLIQFHRKNFVQKKYVESFHGSIYVLQIVLMHENKETGKNASFTSRTCHSLITHGKNRQPKNWGTRFTWSRNENSGP